MKFMSGQRLDVPALFIGCESQCLLSKRMMLEIKLEQHDDNLNSEFVQEK